MEINLRKSNKLKNMISWSYLRSFYFVVLHLLNFLSITAISLNSDFGAFYHWPSLVTYPVHSTSVWLSKYPLSTFDLVPGIKSLLCRVIYKSWVCVYYYPDVWSGRNGKSPEWIFRVQKWEYHESVPHMSVVHIQLEHSVLTLLYRRYFLWCFLLKTDILRFWSVLWSVV